MPAATIPASALCRSLCILSLFAVASFRGTAAQPAHVEWATFEENDRTFLILNAYETAVEASTVDGAFTRVASPPAQSPAVNASARAAVAPLSPSTIYGIVVEYPLRDVPAGPAVQQFLSMLELVDGSATVRSTWKPETLEEWSNLLRVLTSRTEVWLHGRVISSREVASGVKRWYERQGYPSSERPVFPHLSRGVLDVSDSDGHPISSLLADFAGRESYSPIYKLVTFENLGSRPLNVFTEVDRFAPLRLSGTEFTLAPRERTTRLIKLEPSVFSMGKQESRVLMQFASGGIEAAALEVTAVHAPWNHVLSGTLAAATTSLFGTLGAGALPIAAAAGGMLLAFIVFGFMRNSAAVPLPAFEGSLLRLRGTAIRSRNGSLPPAAVTSAWVRLIAWVQTAMHRFVTSRTEAAPTSGTSVAGMTWWRSAQTRTISLAQAVRGQIGSLGTEANEGMVSLAQMAGRGGASLVANLRDVVRETTGFLREGATTKAATLWRAMLRLADSFAQATLRFAETTARGTHRLAAASAEAAARVADAFAQAATRLAAAFVPANTQFAAGFVQTTSRFAAAFVQATSRFAAAFVQATSRFAAAFVQTTSRFAAAFVQATSRSAAAFVQVTSRFAAAFLQATTRFAATFSEAVSRFFAAASRGMGRFSGLRQGTRRLASSDRSSMGAVASLIRDEVRDVASTVWRTARDVGSFVWRNAREIDSSVWGNARDLATSVWHNVRDLASSVWRNVQEIASSVRRSAGDMASMVTRTTREFAGAVWTSTAGYATRLLAAGREQAASARDAGARISQGRAGAMTSGRAAVPLPGRSTVTIYQPLRRQAAVVRESAGRLAAALKHDLAPATASADGILVRRVPQRAENLMQSVIDRVSRLATNVYLYREWTATSIPSRTGAECVERMHRLINEMDPTSWRDTPRILRKEAKRLARRLERDLERDLVPRTTMNFQVLWALRLLCKILEHPPKNFSVAVRNWLNGAERVVRSQGRDGIGPTVPEFLSYL